MKNLRSIHGNIFKIRVDGMNFTCNEEIPSELKDNKEWISNHLSYRVDVLLKVFDIKNSSIHPKKNGYIIEDAKHTGIFAQLTSSKTDIQTAIQFKGYFFTQAHAFEYMKLLMRKIMVEYGQFFRLTLIDVAQDITLETKQVLPFPSADPDVDGFVYNFRYKSSKYIEKTSDGIVETGWQIFNTRFKLKLYDKRFENSKSTNSIKKDYYETLFSEVGGKPVSRIELTLRQESCKRFWKAVFEHDYTEEDFCLDVYKHFSLKHSVRVKENGKDINRWAKLQNWIDLFERSCKSDFTAETVNDFKLTGINDDLQKGVYYLSLAFLAKGHLSRTEIMGKIDDTYSDIVKASKKIRKKRSVTKAMLSKLFAEIKESSDGILEESPDGVSIISPSNCIQHFNNCDVNIHTGEIL